MLNQHLILTLTHTMFTKIKVEVTEPVKYLKVAHVTTKRFPWSEHTTISIYVSFSSF